MKFWSTLLNLATPPRVFFNYEVYTTCLGMCTLLLNPLFKLWAEFGMCLGHTATIHLFNAEKFLKDLPNSNQPKITQQEGAS